MTQIFKEYNVCLKDLSKVRLWKGKKNVEL